MIFLLQLEYSIQIWLLFGPILTLWRHNFQILEKRRNVKFFTSKICMVRNLKLPVVVWSRYIALELLWRIWENDVKEDPRFTPSSKYCIKSLQFYVKLQSFSCWKSENWHNFWSRRDFAFLKKHFLNVFQLKKNKITCIFGSAVALQRKTFFVQY